MQQESTAALPWTLSRKICFRFFCSFFILYTFPYPLDSPPFRELIDKLSENILGWYYRLWEQVSNFWHWLIPVTGKYVLGLKTPITIFTNGSGDTTYDYVLLFTYVLLAAITCIVWSIIDKKRKSYATAYYWLCVLIRYYLASMMLVYGFIKVFHLQMPYPSLSRLVQPYGTSSPMGLAWTYVGQSKAFSIIVGWSEVTCGLLLLFRKTALAGALLSLIVMGNVVIINFCYDVPVKLFSSVLELMAFYLAFPYLKQLYRLFIRHQPAVLRKQEQPLFTKKWMPATVKVLKVLVIADLLFGQVSNGIDGMKTYGDKRSKPPLYGIYNANLVIKNNDTLPLSITDTVSWKQLIIDREGSSAVKTMNDSVKYYAFKVDTTLQTAVVYSWKDTANKSTLHYITGNNSLVLTGRLNSDSVYMRFNRFDEKNFILINRGFHWINEYPFNR